MSSTCLPKPESSCAAKAKYGSELLAANPGQAVQNMRTCFQLDDETKCKNNTDCTWNVTPQAPITLGPHADTNFCNKKGTAIKDPDDGYCKCKCTTTGYGGTNCSFECDSVDKKHRSQIPNCDSDDDST